MLAEHGDEGSVLQAARIHGAFAAAQRHPWLLQEYDINYYLDEMPLEFKLTASIGVLLSGLLLVLMERSRQTISGHRHRILLWMVVWLVLGLIVNAAATIVVGAVGRLVIPSAVGPLTVLAGRIGLMLIT